MIIINQEKNELVNFDNIMCINITDCEEDGYLISAGFIVGRDDNYRELGYYNTEERAKEVLAEIVQKYSSYLQLNGGPAILQGQMHIQPNIFNIPKVYEMPKEWLKINKKELKERIENAPKNKYIYQRYNGIITKYIDNGDYYINCKTGIATKKNEHLMLGKVSEKISDLVEKDDIVNGYRILEIYEATESNEERILDIGYGMAIFNDEIKTILTKELYEGNCYKAGGEDE